MIKKKQRPAKLRYFILIFVSKQILPTFMKFHNHAINKLYKQLSHIWK